MLFPCQTVDLKDKNAMTAILSYLFRNLITLPTNVWNVVIYQNVAFIHLNT